MSPGQSTELAAMFVKFQMEGLKPLQDAISETILKSMDVLAARINDVGQKIDEAMKSAGAAVTAVAAKTLTLAGTFGLLAAGISTGARVAASALIAASASAMGFATAGIALSGVGTQLAFWMERLSLTIAGMFGPEIRAAVNAVANLVIGIQNLNGGQLETIAKVLELTAAFRLLAGGGILGVTGGIAMLALATDQLQPLLNSVGKLITKVVDAIMPLVEVVMNLLKPALEALVSIIQWLADHVTTTTVKWAAFLGIFALTLNLLPTVVSAIAKLVSALRTLFTAQAAVMALGGPAAWANIAAAIVIAAGATYALSEAIDSVGSGTKDKGPRMPFAKKVGGVESIEAQYNRLAAAAVSATGGGTAGATPEEKSANFLEQLVKLTEQSLWALQNQHPVVGGRSA